MRDLFLTLPNQYYDVEYPLKASYRETREVDVEVEPIDEGGSGHSSDASVRATGVFSASSHVAEMLHDLAAGQAPLGTTQPPPSPGFGVRLAFDPETRAIPEGRGIEFELLPEGLRSFAAQAGSEVADYARRTILVMRWRQATDGPHSPFASNGARFSLDRVNWEWLPQAAWVDVSSRSSLSFRGTQWQEVVDLVTKGGDEPFSFTLYREAQNQWSTNPRSALLLGIAAAEIAFKECVATLVPGAAWLALQVPSPPLVRMLREYLPHLPAVHTIDGKVIPLPEAQLKKLDRGVIARNELAHRGGDTLHGAKLKALLEIIDDLLWLLAFYGGVDWALDHVSLETRRDLGCNLTEHECEVLFGESAESRLG